MICRPVMPGNSTEAVSTADSEISTEITTEVNMLVRRPLTQGPRTARSLHSSSRNTVAAGSSTPASAWTPSMIRPSGARGMSTMAAATAISAA